MTGENHLNSEWIVAFVGHGQVVAGDAEIGVSESLCTKAPGDLLLDLAHSQIAFRAVVCEGDVRQLSIEQDGSFTPLETFPEIVSVRLGDRPSFAVLSGRNGWKFLFYPVSGSYGSVFGDSCILQRSVICFWLCDDDADFPEQALYLGCPIICLGERNIAWTCYVVKRNLQKIPTSFWWGL